MTPATTNRLDALMARDDAVAQLDRQCWVLRLPNGEEADGGIWEDPHYETKEDAAQEAAEQVDDPPRVLVPIRLDTSCWTATAVCGRPYSGGDFHVEHWPTRGDLLDMLLQCDWKPVEGGGMTCGDKRCSTCSALPTAPTPISDDVAA